MARSIALRGFVGRLHERAAHEALARLPFHRSLREDAALVVGLHVVQTGRRVERRRVPVGRAVERRADALAFRRRLHVGHADRSSLRRQAGRPGDVLDVLACREELAGRAIEHVEEAVAVGLHQQLARLPLPVDVDERRRFLRVVVPDIVRRELEVPLQLSRLRIEREDRIGVEVVAEAIVADRGRARDCRSASRACRARDRRCRSAMSPRRDDRCLRPSTFRSPARQVRGTVQKRQTSLPVA